MNLGEFRALVPLVKQRSYFFAGAISPVAEPVLKASQRFLASLRDEPLVPYQSWPHDLEELRRAFAALIGAPSSQVAITDNTSRASALAIRLLDRIDPEGAIVVDDTTYPSSIYTWLTHGRHQIRPVATRSAASGEEAAAAIARTGSWTLDIVKRNELHRFVVLPKRWIVERTLAWISRNRRLARDFERYARTRAAFVRLAMIRIMLRRLTRPVRCS